MDADFLEQLAEACEPIFVRQLDVNGPMTSTGKPRRLYSKAFQEWYEAYPLKVGKWKANAAYIKAGERIKVERNCDGPAARDILLEAAKAFAKSEVAKTPFCPNPTTWLNGSRWDDDRSAWNRVETKPQQKPAGESGTEKARRLFGEDGHEYE